MSESEYRWEKGWAELTEKELEGHAKILLKHENRLDEYERRQDMLYTGLALARWIIAVSIPTLAVVVALWRG